MLSEGIISEKLFKESSMNDEQFCQVLHDFKDTVYRVALNYLNNPHNAEDISQEVFLRLYRTANPPEDPTHIKAWLIRVTINECKRSFSSPWNKFVSIDECLALPSFDSSELTDIYRAVMTLPSKYRVVVYLYYYEGYSTGEIASMLGVSTSAVCSRLERARNKLKLILLEDEYV